ncbi:DNA recombination protein RmuC, partial [bacterium]|nr:DNA recombination protein RmuC [bacterium]
MIYLCFGLTGGICFLLGIFFANLFNQKTKNTELFMALSDFRKSMDEYKSKSLVNSQQLKDAIMDAQKLSKALTTNQNLKGKFAEDCLEEVLQACYPAKNINYIKQFKTTNENNDEIKPDYVINLPNNKSVLIDCKLNLEKFIEYQNNPDKKNDFIKDINNTINNLPNKKYETSAEINQPDFILMYIPLESMVSAIYTDKELIQIVKNATE